MPEKGTRVTYSRRGRFGVRGTPSGELFQGNPNLGLLLPFMMLGFMGSFAISIASTALANSYIEHSKAKTITVVVTVCYALGLILMCIWGCMNPESRKKFGKANSRREYPKGLTIVHFVIT